MVYKQQLYNYLSISPYTYAITEMIATTPA
jgi:hypothetical protein